MDKLLHEAAATVLAFLISLVPPALGAIVSMLVDDGISLGKMLARLWVGVIVSYFVGRACDAMFGMHPFVADAISFLIGMVAYKAAPGFIAACSTVLAELPGQLRDRAFALFPRKDR